MGKKGKYHEWNNQNIKKQIEHLKQINENERYTFDIDSLYEVLNDEIVPFLNEFSLQEKLKYDKEKLTEYNYFFNEIKKFIAFSNPIRSEELYLINLPTSELLYFVNDFFKKVYPNWYPIFNKVYKEKKNNFKISNKRSFELYIKGIDYSYINLERRETVEDLASIVHEYVHAVIDHINHRGNYDSQYPFIELPSITSELIERIIINETYANLNKEYNAYLKGYLKSIVNYAKQLLGVNSFVCQYNLDEDLKNIYGNINRFCNKNVRLKNNLEHVLQIENISYVLSFIYAIELYYDYLLDPDKFQYNINAIVNMDNGLNYLNELKKLGLNPNKHTQRFIASITSK